MNTPCRAVLALLLGLAANAAADVETVSIPSRDGKLILTGYWFPAPAGAEPLPAVISLHGCGGLLDDKGRLGAGYFRDADYFNVERMHFLALDSFTPRGFKSICEIPNRSRTVFEEDRRGDVFAAMQWLARQPGVDKRRIALLGRSHGGQTVLSTLDRTDKAVQAEALQPKAAVALYPGCNKFERMWSYELAAPLSLMVGALDDWAPAVNCENLSNRLRRNKQPIDFVVFPDSHHGFDGVGQVTIKQNVGNTRTGNATVGGNPAAREQAYRHMFDFLSAQFETPLKLTHEQRFKGHRYQVPAPSDFAAAEHVEAVPLGKNGRARYKHYLGLNPRRRSS